MKNIVISTKIPQRYVEEIEKLIADGRYMNNSDFLRTAVRTEIKKVKEEQ